MPDLNRLLPGIRYVVVGGTATSLYMAVRVTKDVDILVCASELERVRRVLSQGGAKFLHPLSFASSLGISGEAWKLTDGTELDVLWSARSWAKEALAQPNWDAAGLPIVALPYLVLLKMDASRSIDFGDISRMLGGADDRALDRVRKVIRKHLPEVMDDLEGFIQIGRLEFQALPEATPGAGPGGPANAESAGVVVREHRRQGRLVREHTRRRTKGTKSSP
ncbi:MAG: hypothetical protein HY675_02515 [Chloroflexi bacterium]|nr:hypothetical protein [Chloroflexota bacterium]